MAFGEPDHDIDPGIYGGIYGGSEEAKDPGFYIKEPITFGGFGDESAYDAAPGGEGEDEDQEGLDYLSMLQERAQSSAGSAYGQNAAQRWGGTPAIGLGIFQGHRPPNIVVGFDQRGRPNEQFRTSPGAPMARPPEGLIGGAALANAAAGNGVSSLTPESQWRGTFGPTSTGVHLTGGMSSVPYAETHSGGLGGLGGKRTINSQYGSGSTYAY